MEKLPINIYADGATIEEIAGFDKSIVKGYTFNPTLFKSLGVVDYLGHCTRLAKLAGNLPISLEVISDTKDEMIRQARTLANIGDNVYVKIPITFCNGKSTFPVIHQLVSDRINLNITAIFTMRQIQEILPYIMNTHSILSVFAGRLFDIGKNATVEVFNMAELVHADSYCRLLWASPRQVYDIFNAVDAGCDIITMTPSLIKKLSLFDKTPKEYSLDTVKLFFEDAKNAKYSF
jgi:transaldolase